MDWVEVRAERVIDEIGPLESYTQVKTPSFIKKEEVGLAERAYRVIYPYLSIKPDLDLGNGRCIPICESWGYKILFATPRYRLACPSVLLDLGVAGRVHCCLYDVPKDSWEKFWAVLGILG